MLPFIPFIPSGCVLLLTQGYQSFDFISYLRDIDKGHFLFRCPAEPTFPAVEAFVCSGRQENEISIPLPATTSEG